MKRSFDVLASGVALLVLLPVLAIIAILVRWHLGAPVLFSQQRPGLGGRLFRMWKFRTMSNGVDADGRLLPDAQRLTKFGARLRSTSLDELPELWNVLCGDMSLVGPRPLLPSYLARYSPEEGRRHEVRPGLTGWAQVNGRNLTDWDARLRLDVWYVDHRSFWLDLRIIARTVKIVLRREGISSAGEATMSEFRPPS
jgi:lipopolysaccharide/colanic/teichoic acid biosynthesis glycosyltransferase